MTAASVFVKFSRDKRGYEHFYLVHPMTNRRGRSRTRILYWFRTPPGVRVGRLPFDDDMRRAIEAQNPGVSFDWKRLVATSIPPPAPDVEHWRERRRAERAERAVRRAEEGAEREAEDVEPPAEAGIIEEAEPAEPAEPGVRGTGVVSTQGAPVPRTTPVPLTLESEADPAVLEPIAVAASTEGPARRRRRRRRGGRGHHRPAPSGKVGADQTSVPAASGAPSEEPPPAAAEPGEE